MALRAISYRRPVEPTDSGSAGPDALRFNAWMREIGDVSKQMLSRTPKQLAQDGFITRTLYPEVPPRVAYALTPLGRSFREPIQQRVNWADT